MRRRCHNPKDKDWRYYGGRGITVCDEWRHDFTAFRNWAIKNGIRRGLTMERKDNDKGYAPENCRWVPQSEQSINRSMSKLTEADVRHIRATGMTYSEVTKRYKLAPGYAYKVIRGITWPHVKP
jgi:hypothetical protein